MSQRPGGAGCRGGPLTWVSVSISEVATSKRLGRDRYLLSLNWCSSSSSCWLVKAVRGRRHFPSRFDWAWAAGGRGGLGVRRGQAVPHAQGPRLGPTAGHLSPQRQRPLARGRVSCSPGPGGWTGWLRFDGARSFGGWVSDPKQLWGGGVGRKKGRKGQKQRPEGCTPTHTPHPPPSTQAEIQTASPGSLLLAQPGAVQAP